MKLLVLTTPRSLTLPTTAQLLREAALIGGLALATGVAAHVRLPLPFTPVPLTLQTLAVLLAGGLLGARRGVAAQVLYLLLAALGLPLLAGPTLCGPTGGYLLGFVAAAGLMGLLAPRGGLRVLAGALGGAALILVCGATWLWAVTGCTLGQAFAWGVAPFVAGDLLKALTAAGVVRLVRR